MLPIIKTNLMINKQKSNKSNKSNKSKSKISRNYDNNVVNNCIYQVGNTEQLKVKNYTLIKQLGKFIISGHGKVFEIMDDNKKYAVKIFIYDQNNKNNAKYKKANTELKILGIIKKQKHNVMHFPKIYDIKYCEHNNKTFNNKTFPYIEDVINFNYKLVYTDLAEGTLQDFITNNYIYDDYIGAICQIIFSTYFFHKYIKHLHNDLHWGNMLYQKYTGDISYTINRKKYKLINQKYRWIIWDYDTCTPLDNGKPNNEYKRDYMKILSNFNIITLRINISPNEKNFNYLKELYTLYINDVRIRIVKELENSLNEDDFIINFINYCISRLGILNNKTSVISHTSN